MSQIKVGDICVYDHSGNKTNIKLSDICIVMDANFLVKFINTGYTDRVSSRDLRKVDDESVEKLMGVAETAAISILSTVKFIQNELSSKDSLNTKVLKILDLDLNNEEKSKMINDIVQLGSDPHVGEMSKVFSVLKDFVDHEQVLFTMESSRSGAMHSNNVINAIDGSRRIRRGHIPITNAVRAQDQREEALVQENIQTSSSTDNGVDWFAENETEF
jgi:hypothetical protein